MSKIYGSKDTTRKAFELGIIHDGQTWMDMIKSKNITSHTYNEKMANEIIEYITKSYCWLFEELKIFFEKEKNNL